MLLGIAADLSAPPSSPAVFRDVCLWSKIVRDYDVIAISPEEMIDLYVKWFREKGLFDYVDEILPPGQIVYFDIEISSGKLTAHNLHLVLSIL